LVETHKTPLFCFLPSIGFSRPPVSSVTLKLVFLN
jgi:hypothetical protein